jgi:molecular chaperone HtpG
VNRERITRLLRFASTHGDTDEQTVSLADYLSRMKEGQDKIYYITADSLATAKNSPHLEIFRRKGIEALLLSDRVDEWVVSNLTEFEGKPLQSAAKGDLDLGKLADEEKKEQQKEAGEYKDLVEKIKKTLDARVQDVRLTFRLTSSPACLVSDQHGMSANLERMLKAAGQKVPGSKPVLEINPRHPLVQRLKYESDEARFGDWSHILFDQALLAEGGQLDDPAGFVKRLNYLMLAMSGDKP